MKSIMSILGLYNYDGTIFDNMTLPEGVDKNLVINNLLIELSELEILYTNPETMKAVIGFWSGKELTVWEKLLATTTIEYDPISNLRREETVTNTETRDLIGNSIHKSDTEGTTTNSGTDTQKEYVSGFNEASETFAKKTEQILGAGNAVIGSVESTDDSTDKGTVTTANTAHYQGSIGVVLTQQMIEAERKVSQFNIINYIIDSFKQRFCLLIY